MRLKCLPAHTRHPRPDPPSAYHVRHESARRMQRKSSSAAEPCIIRFVSFHARGLASWLGQPAVPHAPQSWLGCPSAVWRSSSQLSPHTRQGNRTGGRARGCAHVCSEDAAQKRPDCTIKHAPNGKRAERTGAYAQAVRITPPALVCRHVRCTQSHNTTLGRCAGWIHSPSAEPNCLPRREPDAPISVRDGTA